MVYGLWFMVYDLWFTVYGLWFTAYGLWFMVYDLRFIIGCIRFRVYGVGYMSTKIGDKRRMSRVNLLLRSLQPSFALALHDSNPERYTYGAVRRCVEGCSNYQINKAAWMLESKPINLGFGMYLDV